jgi:hypothetical protein
MTEETGELLRQLDDARVALDARLEAFDTLGLAARRAGATWREVATAARVSTNTVHGWWSHADGARRFSLAGLRATAVEGPPRETTAALYARLMPRAASS